MEQSATLLSLYTKNISRSLKVLALSLLFIVVVLLSSVIFVKLADVTIDSTATYAFTLISMTANAILFRKTYLAIRDDSLNKILYASIICIEVVFEVVSYLLISIHGLFLYPIPSLTTETPLYVTAHDISAAQNYYVSQSLQSHFTVATGSDVQNQTSSENIPDSCAKSVLHEHTFILATQENLTTISSCIDRVAVEAVEQFSKNEVGLVQYRLLSNWMQLCPMILDHGFNWDEQPITYGRMQSYFDKRQQWMKMAIKQRQPCDLPTHIESS